MLAVKTLLSTAHWALLRVSLLFAMLCLLGCGRYVKPSTTLQNRLQSRLDGWIGWSGDNLATTWGVPNGRQTLSDGGAAVTYSSDSVNSSTGVCFTANCVPSTRVYSLTCSVTFELDAEGAIVDSSWDGNLSQCDDLIRQPPQGEPRLPVVGLGPPVPHLGIRGVFLSKTLADQLGSPVSQGFYVGCAKSDLPAVLPDSPAMEAGLQAADVIVSIDDRAMERGAYNNVLLGAMTIADKFDGTRAFVFGERSVGDTIQIKVLRGRKTRNHKIKLIAFRWPLDGLARQKDLWIDIKKEPDGRIRYAAGDPKYLYLNGFVDTDTYSLSDWMQALAPFLQSDGSYLVDEQQFVNFGKFRWQYLADEYARRGAIRKLLSTRTNKRNVEEQLACVAF